MAQLKTYKSSSFIHVILNSNKIRNKRITFDEINGGSIYMTDDPDLQEAFESNPLFGKLYVLDTTPHITEEVKPVQDEVKTETTIKVSSIAEAKDFLVENFDYTRSSLRSKDAIIKAGAEHNVTFEGL